MIPFVTGPFRDNWCWSGLACVKTDWRIRNAQSNSVIYRTVYFVTWVATFNIWFFSLKGECDAVLGIQNKSIPESGITASSQLSPSHAPSLARLDNKQGAWCSAPNDSLPYIEILLDEETFVTEIVTQGSEKDVRWATKYQIQYLKEGRWIPYRKTDGSQVSNTPFYSCVLSSQAFEQEWG